MLRKINHVLNLYLCQSANWQCVIESEDEESAATTAVEMVMLNSKEDFYCLASTIIVKKLSNNLLDPLENFDPCRCDALLFLCPGRCRQVPGASECGLRWVEK